MQPPAEIWDNFKNGSYKFWVEVKEVDGHVLPPSSGDDAVRTPEPYTLDHTPYQHSPSTLKPKCGDGPTSAFLGAQI